MKGIHAVGTDTWITLLNSHKFFYKYYMHSLNYYRKYSHTTVVQFSFYSACMHAHTHAHTQTNTHTDAHTRTHMHTYTHTHRHTHTCTCTHTHTECGSQVWDPHLQKRNKTTWGCQKFGLRICAKQLSYNELLSNLAWCTHIYDRRLYLKLATMYKIVHVRPPCFPILERISKLTWTVWFPFLDLIECIQYNIRRNYRD